MENNSEGRWDVQYEWKAILLLAVGFGLVGIDRFMIMPMFPVMMKELKLDYQDLGHITGILAVAWGVSALFMGGLSDRIGRKKVLIPSIVLFSLLAGLSGLATGVLSLLLIRATIGAAEGAFTPASIVATLEASKPSRQGFNLGLQQMVLPLFGLGISPILATQLLHFIDWHWVFVLVAIPGLIVAFLMHKVLRDDVPVAPRSDSAVANVVEHRWTEVFRYRNVWLNMLSMLCWLTCLIVVSALFPSYLTDFLHLNLEQMGFVLSAIGFGAGLGALVMPSLSDRVGRKPVMIVSVLGALVFLILLQRAGAHSGTLFGLLFMTCFFNFSLICLTVGPLSAESVPPGLMSTASGIAVGVGEIFGGGVAPVIAGYVAKHSGIETVFYLAIGGLSLGLIVVLALKETAPLRLKKQDPVLSSLGA